MKSAWTIPLCIAVAVGTLAFAAARCIVCRCPAPSRAELGDVRALTRTLGLTPSQATALQALQARYGAKLSECNATHCSARRGLAAEISEEAGSAERTDASVAELCRAYERTERLTLAHLRAVRALLNPEQRTKFDALMMRCRCSSCIPQGGGTTTHTEEHK